MGSDLLTDWWLRSCAIASIIASGYVTITGIVFWDMLQKRFMQLIFLISLCDLIGSIVTSWGVVDSNSPLCVPQAILRIFFYRSSWLWTTILASQLYTTLRYGGLWISNISSHLVVWLISVPLIVLPLSTTEYGQDDELSGVSWCSLKAGNTTNGAYVTGIWLLLASGIPLCLSVLICLILIILMYYHYRKTDLRQYPQILRTIDSVKLYPIAMVISWGGATVWSLLVNFRILPISLAINTYIIVSEGLGALYGLFVGSIFFWKSKESFQRWKRLLCGYDNGRHDSTATENGKGSIIRDFEPDRNISQFGLSFTSESDYDSSFHFSTTSIMHTRATIGSPTATHSEISSQL